MKKSHAMEVLFPLVLFGVFAVMSLFLVLIGSGVYSKILDNSDANGTLRVSVSYIANRLRAYDSAECAVYTAGMGGVEVLILEEEYNGCVYQNLIYYYDNAIRETMIQKGWDFQPEFGEMLVEASGFWVECQSEGQIIAFTVADTRGKQQSLEITYRSGYVR